MRISSALPSGVVVAKDMTEGRLRRICLVALPLAVACGSGEARPPVSSESPPPAEAPRERWPRFDEVANWPAINDRAFSTRGHLVKPSHALVRVSPDARSQYLALVTDSVLPDGSVIAMFHQSRDGARNGLVYVMEKKAGEWTFLALDADGRVATENLNVCALCHKGGVADHLFGLPRSLTAKGPRD